MGAIGAEARPVAPAEPLEEADLRRIYLRDIVHDVRQGVPVGEIASAFHVAVVELVAGARDVAVIQLS